MGGLFCDRESETATMIVIDNFAALQTAATGVALTVIGAFLLLAVAYCAAIVAGKAGVR
jgi:hypothetical protein